MPFIPLYQPLEEYLREPGEPLGELDGTKYFKLEIVIQEPAEGSGRSIYSLYRDWWQTTAGRLIQQQYLLDQSHLYIDYMQQRHAVEIESLRQEYRTAMEALRQELSKPYQNGSYVTERKH